MTKCKQYKKQNLAQNIYICLHEMKHNHYILVTERTEVCNCCKLLWLQTVYILTAVTSAILTLCITSLPLSFVYIAGHQVMTMNISYLICFHLIPEIKIKKNMTTSIQNRNFNVHSILAKKATQYRSIKSLHHYNWALYYIYICQLCRLYLVSQLAFINRHEVTLSGSSCLQLIL